MEPVSRSEIKIAEVHSLGSGRMLLLFINGTWVTVDFAELIAKGGVFTRLADDDYLAAARIMEGGYFLEWPDELDIGADSLWRRGKRVTEKEAAQLVGQSPSRVA